MAKPNVGSRAYTRFALSLYDTGVLWFNMNYVWKCSTDEILLPFFAEHFSKNHLDVGVGTGYFPANALRRQRKESTRGQSKSSTESPQRITLMDLNTNSLETARNRILSQAPETAISCVVADVRDPITKEMRLERFSSISMMNLLHCVPRPMSRKLLVFRHLKRLLTDDGVLFGCTVLGRERRNISGNEEGAKLPMTWLPWLFMLTLNWLGGFDNWADGPDAFENALRQDFDEVDTWIVGMMLLFRASKPRRN